MFRNQQGERFGRECLRSSVRVLSGIPMVVALHVAHASDLREDAVPGTCSALVSHVAAPGVKGFDGKTVADRWGVTQAILYIGTKRVDDRDVMNEVHVEINPVRAGGDAPKTCVEAAKVSPAFRAEVHVGVIEWVHKHKPDSACAKEWQRVRNVVRVHEAKHVSDIDDSVRDANARVSKRLPVRACAASVEEARVQAARAIATMLQQEVGALQGTLNAKAAKRDVENAQMDCKLCNDKISFKGVTLDCVVRTPVCTVRMGQKLEGRACGDPVNSPWTISPRYFTEGCGAPPSNGKGDKPFTNDCVEAGSDIEKRRAETYRKFRSTGAGGWMCVYTASPKPQITIRNFRSSVCTGAAEQTITVDAEASEGCDDPPPLPPKTPAPAQPLPNS